MPWRLQGEEKFWNPSTAALWRPNGGSVAGTPSFVVLTIPATAKMPKLPTCTSCF